MGLRTTPRASWVLCRGSSLRRDGRRRRGRCRQAAALKFADGCLERYREGAFAADEIRPLQFESETVALLGDLEGVGGECDDVVATVDPERAFESLLEGSHVRFPLPF